MNPTMEQPIHWGILGLGKIARSFATDLVLVPDARLYAVASRDQAKSESFAAEFGAAKAYTSYAEMLADPEVQAVYIATPHTLHLEHSLMAIRAGKHVLCEKPIAPTAPEGLKLVRAAEKAGVINMINFSYRNNPVLHHARRFVEGGKLGRIMHFEARYLQTWLTAPIWGDWRTSPGLLWRLSTAHGSKGALGDIGVHIADLATYVAAQRVVTLDASLKTFSKIQGDRVGEYALDANDSAYLRVELEGGGLGTICTTRWATGQVNTLALSLHGDQGALRFDLDKSDTDLEVCLGRDVAKVKWKTIKSPAAPNIYRRFITSIRTGRNDSSDFRRGWEVQKILDAAFLSDARGTTVKLKP
ncbi:MAG: Gfo/Idh/MocA family protein [Kiritimatiellia bacterium]